MSFLKRLFGKNQLDGVQLAQSSAKPEYSQIALLKEFLEGRQPHAPAEQQRWNRALQQPYAKTLETLTRQGWLEEATMGIYRLTPAGNAIVDVYRQRLEEARAAVMPKVREALVNRDTAEALRLRRAYEAWFPLETTDWTGPEPQLSYSALTRRILFLEHWLLDGLRAQTVEWLKLYAAEQHLWGAYWRLPEEEIPAYVVEDLANDGDANAGIGRLPPAEGAYWKAYQLALYVDNHETWQRCKGGDHVRRIEITCEDDEYTCEPCRSFLSQQFLVARVPELPHRDCTSVCGCRCRYEPVLEMLDDISE